MLVRCEDKLRTPKHNIDWLMAAFLVTLMTLPEAALTADEAAATLASDSGRGDKKRHILARRRLPA